MTRSSPTYGARLASRARALELEAEHPTRPEAALAQQIIQAVTTGPGEAAYDSEQARAIGMRYRAAIASQADPNELPVPPASGAGPKAHSWWLRGVLTRWGWLHVGTRQVRRGESRPRISEFVRDVGQAPPPPPPPPPERTAQPDPEPRPRLWHLAPDPRPTGDDTDAATPR